jgi:hypothetical protein
MKLAILAAFAIAAQLPASQKAGRDQFPLRVYLLDLSLIPPRMWAPAQGTASRMLADAGVRVTWHHRLPRQGESLPENTMIVKIVNDPDAAEEAASFAAAQVYEGSAITLFYNRVKWAERMPTLGGKVLAHILVHEIAHNLQGVARHSDTGVMKARWTQTDYAEMSRRPLPFEPLDLELIERGLNRRRAGAARAEPARAR